MSVKEDIYKFLHNEIRAKLIEFGMCGDTADDAADSIINVLRRILGGDRPYWRAKPSQSEIKKAIDRKGYDGHAQARKSICSELGISESTFYRAINSTET